MEQLWAKRIADAGNDGLFRARAIRAVGHCDFKPEEEVRALDDLVACVENGGPAPAGDNILDPATVAAASFGCQFTTAGRMPDDPDYDAACITP